MKTKATALMLADLGVVKSRSRPHTSNHNPFSEAHFKTLKYQPEFQKRFQTINEARRFCRRFFARHTEDHHPAGIGLMTPDQIHFGQADAIHDARQTALDAAFLGTPDRFVRQDPKPPQIPTAVWINPPKKTEPAQAQTQKPDVLKSLTRSGQGRFQAQAAVSGVVEGLSTEALAVLREDSGAATVQPVALAEALADPTPGVVITLDDAAANSERPAWPGLLLTAHGSMPDPSGLPGTAEQVALANRILHSRLHRQIAALIGLPFGQSPQPLLQVRLDVIG